MAIRNPTTMRGLKTLALLSLGLLAGCGEPSPWIAAGTFSQGRSHHSATLLDNELVLFAGGKTAGFLGSTELRDSISQRWSKAGSLITPRAEHLAIKIDDGRVVVLGGIGDNGILDSVEVFDFGTKQFSAFLPMLEPRTQHAVIVREGKLFAMGGRGPSGVSSTIEVGEIGASAWSFPTTMPQPRAQHTATLLADGTILIVGGTDGTDELASAVRYDVATNTWLDAGNMAQPRRGHTATRLDASKVLVAGGTNASGVLATAEVYDITTNAWSGAASMRDARQGHTATRLNDGTVLLTGGNGASDALQTVERYCPVRSDAEKPDDTTDRSCLDRLDLLHDEFVEVTPMALARVGHSATWLANGSVLVAGGDGAAASVRVDQYVPEDNRIFCERSEECPTAMVCNVEDQRCEHAERLLSSESACAYVSPTNRSPGRNGVFVVGLGFALAMMRRKRRPSGAFSAALIASSLLALPGLAEAQTSTFYLDRLPLAAGPNDGTAVWRPVFGPTQLFGQVGLGYARDPLRASAFVADPTRANALQGSAVHLQVSGYATLGMEVLRRGAISVTVPYIVQQRGYPTDNRSVGLDDRVTMTSRALGDVRVDGRMSILWNSSRSFSMAARAAFFLPFGDEYSFAGERSAWGQVGLSAEYNAEVFFLTTNAGLTVRPQSRLVDLLVGTEFVYAVGAYVPLLADRVRLGAELFGSVGLVEGSGTPPTEVALSSRVALGTNRLMFLGASAGMRVGDGTAPDMRFVARIGGILPLEREDRDLPIPVRLNVPPEADSDRDGIVDVDDACPAVAEDHAGDDDGCPKPSVPAVVDTDGDGLKDPVDRCPGQAEDMDGLDDEDGCPDEDVDKDGIADAADKCPKEPGVHAKDPANEGCPAFLRRTGTEVKLLVQIEFEFSSTTIAKSSYPILDELARLLTANPDIKRMRIEGHTDNAGSESFNKTISTRRAESVRNYLVQQGKVDPSRLSFEGFGPSRPIAPNNSDAGRAKNRRVELHIETSTAGKESPP